MSDNLAMCAATSVLFFVLALQVSCSAQSEPPREASLAPAINKESVPPKAMRDLRAQVETFATGEGNEASWQNLNSRPKSELINDLLNLRRSVPADDPLQVKIAFVLCYLDHEYVSNKAIITSSLSKLPRYEGVYADDVVVLVGRLINKGDADLLSVVFAATEWADGALAEGLTAIIVEEARKNPLALLGKLKNEPAKVRREVYQSIGYGMSDEEKGSLKRHLLSSSPSADLQTVTNELIATLTKKQ